MIRTTSLSVSYTHLAGKSDKSIFAKDGDSGTGNSIKARTKDTAESIAVIASVRALKILVLFLDIDLDCVNIISFS